MVAVKLNFFIIDICMQKYGRFVKFSPLPNTNAGKSKLVPYTKRARRQPSLEFYQTIQNSGFKPRTLPKRTVRLHDPPFYTQHKLQKRLEIGDIVETISRDGETDFGAILNITPDGNYVNVVSANGQASQKHISTISFAMNGFFLKPGDVNKNMASRYLCSIISRALELMPILAPRIRTAYAHLVRDRPDTGFSGVHLLHLYRMTKSTFDSPSLLRNSAESLLAVYLILNCSSLLFWRMSPTVYLALNETSASSINQVMKTLTDVEFDRFVDSLKEQKANQVYTEETEVHNNNEGTSSTALPPVLDRFLSHYVCSQDDRLAPAVDAIMSAVYPQRDSHEWLTSASTVQHLLGAHDGPSNPFLKASGVAELDIENGDGISLKDGLEKDLTLRLEQTVDELSPLTDPKNRVEWKSPVFVFNDDTLNFNKQGYPIGLSVDSVTKRMHLHIPDIGSLLRPRDHRGVLGLLAQRAYSWSCALPADLVSRPSSPRAQLPLFPTTFKNALQLNFSGIAPKLVNCLTISANIQDLSNPESVELIATSISSSLIQSTPNKSIDISDLKAFDKHRALSATNHQSTNFFSNALHPEGTIDLALATLDSFMRQRLLASDGKPNEKSSLLSESQLLFGYLASLLCEREGIPTQYRRLKYVGAPQNPKIEHHMSKYAKNLLSTRYDRQVTVSSENSTSIETFLGCVNPLDSMHSLMSQWKLVPYVWRHLQFPQKHILSQYQDQDQIKDLTATVNSQDRAIRLLKHKLDRYATLHNFELSLKSDGPGYYIFPVTVTQGAAFPDLAKGICEEIGNTEIEIQLLASTQVNVGDTIMCTELVELNPVDGLCVLSM